jgi:hypothetical protein
MEPYSISTAGLMLTKAEKPQASQLLASRPCMRCLARFLLARTAYSLFSILHWGQLDVYQVR